MILVFAGAGASKAVAPSGYPTTIEFFEQLPEETVTNSLFKHVVAFLRGDATDKTIDIEQVLWTLQDAERGAKTAADTKAALGFLLDQSRVHQILGTSADVRPMTNICGSLAKHCRLMMDAINKEVFRLYAAPPEAAGLQSTWNDLLLGLRAMRTPLELFTTNYDTVLEHAIKATGIPIETGRSGPVYTELDTRLWTEGRQSKRGLSGKNRKRGLLTKLHGSVDWSRSGSTIYVGTPTYRGRHDEHAIIYPGFKGAPSEEPFVSFHRHFADCVARARLLVFIGFSFRDEYINSVLERSLQPQSTVMVICRGAKPQRLPFEDSPSVDDAGFDRRAAQDVIRRAQSLAVRRRIGKSKERSA